MHYETIRAALAPFGLLARGGFAPLSADGLPEDSACAVMVGNAGPAMWRVFAGARREEPDAMNRWTRRVLDPVAAELGAQVVYSVRRAAVVSLSALGTTRRARLSFSNWDADPS